MDDWQDPGRAGRSPARRRHKIYLDAFQNARWQTVAAVYGVRPRDGAPVATPLPWSEVKKGLNPQRFTIITVPKRLEERGDLWREMAAFSVDPGVVIAELTKEFPLPVR